MHVVAIPPIGKYTKAFKKAIEELGCTNIKDMPLSSSMIEKGCKNSSDMVCFPFKITLGYFMEALDNGADTLLMFDSGGQCRLRHYYKIQEYTLRKRGYKDFRMIPIRAKSPIKSFKNINGSGTIKVIKVLYNLIKNIRLADSKQRIVDGINIGVIGEIYTAIEPSLNFDIEEKIKKTGMNCYNAVTMSGFLKGLMLKMTESYHKKAMKYFNGPLGGHGIENVASTLMMIEKKFKGIIWFRPLTCMPETTVEPIIKSLCEENDMPLLVIDVDETNAEANVTTRIETFFELIQLRNRKF